jgi:hypothetical protein
MSKATKPADPEAQEERALVEVESRLTERFGHHVDADRIREVVQSCHRRFAVAPVRAFIPILVERLAAAELREHRASR